MSLRVWPRAGFGPKSGHLWLVRWCERSQGPANPMLPRLAWRGAIVAAASAAGGLAIAHRLESHPAAAHPVVAAQARAPQPDNSARLHPNLVVVDSRAVRALFTVIRDAATSHVDFVAHADRLMRLLAEEGLAELPGSRPKTVTTPCGAFAGVELAPARSVAAVSIVRAGDTLLEAVRRVAPAVSVGKILIQRDESTIEKVPRLMYVKLPGDIATRTVLLVDPMLATGQSAAAAIEVLLRRGVPEEKIVFLNVVASPEGLRLLGERHPRVKVVTGAIDEGLNSHKYIVPGLGDFGDRYHGT